MGVVDRVFDSRELFGVVSVTPGEAAVEFCRVLSCEEVESVNIALSQRARLSKSKSLSVAVV